MNSRARARAVDCVPQPLCRMRGIDTDRPRRRAGDRPDRQASPTGRSRHEGRSVRYGEALRLSGRVPPGGGRTCASSTRRAARAGGPSGRPPRRRRLLQLRRCGRALGRLPRRGAGRAPPAPRSVTVVARLGRAAPAATCGAARASASAARLAPGFGGRARARSSCATGARLEHRRPRPHGSRRSLPRRLARHAAPAATACACASRGDGRNAAVSRTLRGECTCTGRAPPRWYGPGLYGNTHGLRRRR